MQDASPVIPREPDREELFQIAIGSFQLGDMSEREFRRRLMHTHHMDEFEIAALIRELQGSDA